MIKYELTIRQYQLFCNDFQLTILQLSKGPKLTINIGVEELPLASKKIFISMLSV